MVISNIANVERIVGNLAHYPLFVDLETTGTNPRVDKIVSIQMYVSDYEPVIIDARHMDMQALGNLLRPVLEEGVIIGQNFKFDYQFLFFHMKIRADKLFDVMLAEQIIKGRGFGDGVGFSLADICKRRGIKIPKEERNWFIDLDKRPEWDQPFPEKQIKYMEQDVTVLEIIYLQQSEEIEQRHLVDAKDLEMRFLPVLANVELTGVRIDEDAWRNVIASEEKRMNTLKEEAIEEFGRAIMEIREPEIELHKEKYDAYQLAKEFEIERLQQTFSERSDRSLKWVDFKADGMRKWREANPAPKPPKPLEINLSSHDQLKAAFKHWGYEVGKLDSEQLEKLATVLPQAELIQKLRKAEKVVQTYGETLLSEIDPVTGKLHFPYQQLVSTSRMAASRIQ